MSRQKKGMKFYSRTKFFDVGSFEAKSEKAQVFLDQVTARIKADGEDRGNLIGYASVFDNGPDLHGDIIARGAFTKTINDRVKNGMIPLLDGHQSDAAHVIGRVVDAIEDEHGLLIHGILSTAPSVQDVRAKLMDGTIDGLSIGFDTIRFSIIKNDDGSNSQHWMLEEIKLFEISVVAIPAREDARILAAKTGDENDESKRDFKMLLETAINLRNNLTPDELEQIQDAVKSAEPEKPLTDIKRLELRERSLKFTLENQK